MSSTLSSKIKNGCLYLVLDHSDKANSFGLIEAEQLSKVLTDTRTQSVKALVFSSSSSRFFCTGGNLDYYAQQDTKEEGLKANLFIRNALDQLSNFLVPSLCVVNGDCLGGGMELLSCFDRIISTPHSFFGFWQRRIALSFGWGGGQRWKKRIPEALLKSLALQANSLCAYEAQKLGLLDEVCSSSSIGQSVDQWVNQVTKWPQAPVQGLKTFSSESEVSLFEGLWHNPEHKNILEKIKKKRCAVDTARLLAQKLK